MTLLRLATGTRVWLAAGLVITGLGFAVRLHNLGGDSLWLDEMATARTSRTLAGALQAERDHPPLTYLLTVPALDVFGETEFAARLPALLAGTVAVPLMVRLGKEVSRPEAGVWAAFLLALSPVHLKYAQEARHYALLMTLSLATFLLLYRALQRPTWRRWLAFALVTVANLYTHYGALIVLVAQGIFIAGWGVWQWREDWRTWRYPAGAALIVTLLYTPWLPRLRAALDYNVGAETVTDTGRAAGLAAWGREVIHVFGMRQPPLPTLLAVLCLLGLLWWAWQRQWRPLALVATGLFLPLLLLQIFPVARTAYARYVIYALPFYLLAIGVAVDTLLRQTRRWGRPAFAVATLAAAGVWLWVAVPLVRAEHRFILHDWRGVVQHLDSVAANGDVVLPLSPQAENGFNIVAASLPYYLDEAAHDTTLLPGHRLRPGDAASLAQSDANVWAVIFDPAQTTTLSSPTTSFQTFLTVAGTGPADASALAQTIALYEQVIPGAAAPLPHCLLQQDLALLYATAGRIDAARATLPASPAECPGAPQSSHAWVEEALLADELAQATQAGETARARELAMELLQHNPNHPAGLETLTAANLLQQFRDGAAQVTPNGAPEPVSVRRFTMPQGGDGGDVLFVHPPAGVHFPLTLPDAPVVFHSRVALDPQSWGWGGDGATFVVQVQTEHGATTELYREHVGNDPAGRGWHPVTVSLAAYAGQTITLTLTTETGPAGDGTGDWAGWETPRLLWHPIHPTNQPTNQPSN